MRTYENIKETFRRSGISHLLAVSGLHVGIFALVCAGLGRWLKMPLPFTCPILILLIVGFVLIVGAKPPTIRAGIMAGTMLFIHAYIEPRPPQAVGMGLGLSAIWLLWVNPALLFHPSFQLSFGAVLSLLLVTPRIDRLLQAGGMKMLLNTILFWGVYCALGTRWPMLLDLRLILFAAILFGLSGRAGAGYGTGDPQPGDSRPGVIPRPVRLLLAAQFAIQIGVIVPLSAHYFGYYSVAGNLVNLLVIPLSVLLVPAILLAAIAGAVLAGPLSPIAVPLAWLAMTATVACYVPAYLGARFLPYPMMPCPNAATLGAYYAAVGIWFLAPIASRLVRTFTAVVRLPRIAPKQIATFAVVLLAWACSDRLQSSWHSPRLLIPDAVARPRVAACPMPILVRAGKTALFNPGSASAAKFTVVPILRRVAREPVAQIVCTTDRVRGGLGGTQYLASQFADATVYVPRHLLEALSARLTHAPAMRIEVQDPGAAGRGTAPWEFQSVVSGQILLEYRIGGTVVWTVPNVATLLAVAQRIPSDRPCDILVLPWQVSDRPNSPSQARFMAALITIIRRLEPDCAIITGGGHPATWEMLRRGLGKKACPTRLIRTSAAGMVIIGAAAGRGDIRSYRSGRAQDGSPCAGGP